MTTRLPHLETPFEVFGEGEITPNDAFSAPLTIKATNLGATPTSNPQPQTIHIEGDLVISAVAGHPRDAPAVIYRIEMRARDHVQWRH